MLIRPRRAKQEDAAECDNVNQDLVRCACDVSVSAVAADHLFTSRVVPHLHPLFVEQAWLSKGGNTT